MDAEITLKNYRCFPDKDPARFSIRRGFTAFVGVNNSGKSSLLRFFYEFRNLFGMVAPNSGNLISALRGQQEAFGLATSVLDRHEVFSDVTKRDLEIDIRLLDPDPKPNPIPQRLSFLIPFGTNTFTASLVVPNRQFDPAHLNFNAATELRTPSGFVVEMEDYYNLFRDLSATLYIGPFRNAINVGTQADYFDIQVGQAFIQNWRRIKSGNVKSENEDAVRLTHDIQQIFGLGSFEISPSQDEKTLQIIVNGKSYKLPEVGSGLTQFILAFANAATRRPSYILIDEPELNLHPSLQIDFLTTLASYAREEIIFGSHNVGLARAVADRIYALRKTAEGESHVRDFEAMRSLSEFLGELSYSGYRELGWNKILLVEGPNEVKTIQQFLRLYKKDHETVLIPLGGSQMINGDREAELEEIKRISPDIHALIDSERARVGDPLNASRQGFVEACRKAGINCHVLERRATENYLTRAAIVRVKGEKYSELGPFQRLNEASPGWAKSENWRMAREMSLEDLQNTDLGRFLEAL